MFNYYGIDIEKKRNSILSNPQLKETVSSCITEADKAINEDSAAFKMSEFMLFFETGNRAVYEKSYFDRRDKCYNILVAYWLTSNEKYMLPLVDYINYICDEYTWCLPAHLGNLPNPVSPGAVECVDLFQADTAKLLCDICLSVGDMLPSYATDRIRMEIRRRIFASFEKGVKYGWETTEHNWTTVCGSGCVVAALCFGTDKEKDDYVNRFKNCLDSYLRGINDDGCCKEGLSYWNYGFSNFVLLAAAVRLYTKGEIDYFKNPKVKQLSAFPQKIRMSEHRTPAFSDGNSEYRVNVSLLSLLKYEYPEISLPEFRELTAPGTLPNLNALLWLDDNYKKDTSKRRTDYFEQSQWYINRTGEFSFAAKGGYNAEPHNHNDLGSFIITVGDEEFITDLGSGVYTKDYFNPETRYTILNTSSRGHSVPIINGEYQSFGKEYRAENVKASDNSFELNIECGYPKGTAKKVHRKFDIGDDVIRLTDSFESDKPDFTVTERFITKHKPVIEDGIISCKAGKIRYDREKYIPRINSEDMTVHGYSEQKQTVYMIDFTSADKNETVFEFEFLPDM